MTFEQLPHRPTFGPEARRELLGQIPQAPDRDLQAVAGSPQQMAHRINGRMREVVTRLHGSITRNREAKTRGAWRAIQAEAGKLHEEQADTVSQCIEGLTMDLPAPAQMLVNPPDVEGRYVLSRGREAPDGTSFGFYAVETSVVQRDRLILRNILQTPGLAPQAQADVGDLLRRLDELEQTDQVSLQAAQIGRQMDESLTAAGLGQMGRMTLALSGTAVALLGGLLAWQTGHFSPITGVYAAIALGAAYPGILRTGEQRLVDQTRSVVQSPAFQALQRQLSPADAAHVLTRLQDEGVRETLEPLVNARGGMLSRNPRAALTPAEIQAAADVLSAGRPSAAAPLRVLFTQDPSLIANLFKTTGKLDEDTARTVSDAARLGRAPASLNPPRVV